MAEVELLAEVTKFIERTPKMTIGGAAVDAESGRDFEVIDPSTGAKLTEVPRGMRRRHRRRRRVGSGRLRRRSLERASPRQAHRFLYKIGAAHQEQHPELAQLEALDSGKPVNLASGEIWAAGEAFRYYAGWPTKTYGETESHATTTCSSTRFGSRWACAEASFLGTSL